MKAITPAATVPQVAATTPSVRPRPFGRRRVRVIRANRVRVVIFANLGTSTWICTRWRAFGRERFISGYAAAAPSP